MDERLAFATSALRTVYRRLNRSRRLAEGARSQFHRQGRRDDAAWSDGRVKALEQALATLEQVAGELADDDNFSLDAADAPTNG